LTKIKLHNEELYTGIITDISERKANEKLKQEFISTVSHELRTPLTSIQGAIKLIQAQNKNGSSQDIQNLIELADRNASRLTALINDLLDFEKLDSDSLEYELQSVVVDDLITTIIENDNPIAEIARVKLRQIEYCQDNVSADPTRLAQVISNLISNAIKFSPQDTDVQIGCHLENSNVKIFVRDQGEGIPEKFKDRIFQRFSQADSSDTKRVQRGTGLGLAISRRMTEDMGGQIGFESNQEKGSTFFVKFPLASNP
jgi:signal transduction histidine kinase